MKRTLAFLALAGFSVIPLALSSQGIPDVLKDRALAVRVHAIVPAPSLDPNDSPSSNPGVSSEKAQDWQAESMKYTVPGTPVPFKLVGSNVAIIVQITPFDREDGKGLTLFAQGQVWVKPAVGGLSYHGTIETLSVEYGETVLFFPLGLGPTGKASMRLEISVFHANEKDAEGGGTGDKAGK